MSIVNLGNLYKRRPEDSPNTAAIDLNQTVNYIYEFEMPDIRYLSTLERKNPVAQSAFAKFRGTMMSTLNPPKLYLNNTSTQLIMNQRFDYIYTTYLVPFIEQCYYDYFAFKNVTAWRLVPKIIYGEEVIVPVHVALDEAYKLWVELDPKGVIPQQFFYTSKEEAFITDWDYTTKIPFDPTVGFITSGQIKATGSNIRHWVRYLNSGPGYQEQTPPPTAPYCEWQSPLAGLLEDHFRIRQKQQTAMQTMLTNNQHKSILVDKLPMDTEKLNNYVEFYKVGGPNSSEGRDLLLRPDIQKIFGKDAAPRTDTTTNPMDETYTQPNESAQTFATLPMTIGKPKLTTQDITKAQVNSVLNSTTSPINVKNYQYTRLDYGLEPVIVPPVPVTNIYNDEEAFDRRFGRAHGYTVSSTRETGKIGAESLKIEKQINDSQMDCVKTHMEDTIMSPILNIILANDIRMFVDQIIEMDEDEEDGEDEDSKLKEVETENKKNLGDISGDNYVVEQNDYNQPEISEPAITSDSKSSKTLNIKTPKKKKKRMKSQVLTKDANRVIFRFNSRWTTDEKTLKDIADKKIFDGDTIRELYADIVSKDSTEVNARYHENKQKELEDELIRLKAIRELDNNTQGSEPPNKKKKLGTIATGQGNVSSGNGNDDAEVDGEDDSSSSSDMDESTE